MKYFRIQEFTLNLMGTFLEREKNTHLRRIQSWVNIILFPINLIPLITTTAFFYPDLTLMSDPIMLLIGIFISMCKLWPLHFGPRNFELLYDKVIKLGATMKIHEEPCVEKSVKFAKFVSKVNLFLLSISMTVFNLIPLVDPIYRTLKGEKDIFWPNAFNWHYPFDMSKNWVYITAYILAFYTFSQICIINNAVDTIFLESCLVGSSHFKILQRRIENVQFKSPGYDKDIIGLIGYHNEIHDLANIVTRAYQAGLFFYFTIASIMICIIFFELLMVRNYHRVIQSFEFNIFISLVHKRHKIIDQHWIFGHLFYASFLLYLRWHGADP